MSMHCPVVMHCVSMQRLDVEVVAKEGSNSGLQQLAVLMFDLAEAGNSTLAKLGMYQATNSIYVSCRGDCGVMEAKA